MNPSLKRLMPELVGFSELFIPFRSSRPTDHENGFRVGSTLLIAGPPGAGKTTFAFALVRSLMAADRDESEHPLLFYVSLETDAERLQNMFWDYGWFADSKKFPDGVFSHGEYDQGTVVLIALQPEIDRPVRSSEEVVNAIFTRIGAESPPGERRPVYVIVDSLTSLIQDAGDTAERRRQVHELIYRIRKTFKNPDPSRLQLSILLSERRAEATRTWSPSIEEYLADIVFRLDVKELAMGRRLRLLEIVKSLGTNMVLGEHTWHICSHESYHDHIIEKHMQKRIKEEATRHRTNKDNPWGTVAIFTRSRSYNLARVPQP